MIYEKNNINNFIKIVCTNVYPSYEIKEIKKKNPAGKMELKRKCIPMLYRRDDLSEWAEEAFKRGEAHFYVKPVNPNIPYGRLELCEPEYKYVFTTRTFSKEEIAEFLSINHNVDDIVNKELNNSIEYIERINRINKEE